MALQASRRPITVDDDTLREHLRGAEAPALLMTVAQLTGDVSILEDDHRPSGWLFLPQGSTEDVNVNVEREAESIAETMLAPVAQERGAG